MSDVRSPSPPRTARGTRTRARLVEAAESVFATLGYHDASIVKITEQAGVGLGTFYLYFGGKLEIFDEVVDHLNRQVRQAMSQASSAAGDRLGAERAGFEAFFRFTAEHPALYRIIRQAEFVSPAAMRRHYTSIVDGYVDGLRRAMGRGEIREIDPTVVAWALMGAGELLGMRWVLWEHDDGSRGEATASAPVVPEHVLDALMDLIESALAPGATDGTSSTGKGADEHA